MIHLGSALKLLPIFILVLAVGFFAGIRGRNQAPVVVSEVAGVAVENSIETTPSPTLNPVSRKTIPTAIPTSKPTATSVPDSITQPSPIPVYVYQANPTPVPTLPPAVYQSNLDYEFNKINEERRAACLAERDAATAPLRIELQRLQNEYNDLPEQITQAMAGKDVSANQLQRMIESRQFEKLEEINDVNSQIQGVEIQHSCY